MNDLHLPKSHILRILISLALFLFVFTQVTTQEYFRGELVYETISNTQTNGSSTTIIVDTHAILQTSISPNARKPYRISINFFDRRTSEFFMCDSSFHCMEIELPVFDSLLSFETSSQIKEVDGKECTLATVKYLQVVTHSLDDMMAPLENMPDSASDDAEFALSMLEEAKSMFGNAYTDVYYLTFDVCIHEEYQIDTNLPCINIPFIPAHGKVYIPLEHSLTKMQSGNMRGMGINFDEDPDSPNAGRKSKEVLKSITPGKCINLDSIRSSFTIVEMDYFMPKRK